MCIANPIGVDQNETDHMKPSYKFTRAVACCTFLFGAAACSEASTEPKGEPGIRVLSGAGVTDTIESFQPAPLLAEVRRANGRLAGGVEVRFEVLWDSVAIPGTMFICKGSSSATCGVSSFQRLLTDTTDSQGRVEMFIRTGTTSGPARILVAVPQLGFVDSAKFTVLPGVATSIRPVNADTAVVFNATATLRAQVLDRRRNVRPTETVTMSAAPGNNISLNATTGVVTGLAMGTQSVYFRLSTFTDSTVVRVVPPGRIIGAPGASVRMINTDGTNEKIVVPSVSGSGLGTFPRFDAARRRIVIGRRSNVGDTDLSVVDTSGTPSRDIDGVALGINSINATRVLPDGSVLALAQKTPIQGFNIFRIGTDNSLTLLQSVPDHKSIFGEADFSLDGTKIVYGAPAAPSALLELRVMDIATGTVKKFEQRINTPRWSKAGDRIAFITENLVSGVTTLIVMNEDGSGRRAVATGVRGPLTWSSDDQYIVGSINSFSTRIIRLSDGATVDLPPRARYRYIDWR